MFFKKIDVVSFPENSLIINVVDKTELESKINERSYDSLKSYLSPLREKLKASDVLIMEGKLSINPSSGSGGPTHP